MGGFKLRGFKLRGVGFIKVRVGIARTLMFDWFHKTLPINTFYVLLVKILRLEKKRLISTSVIFSFLFQEKMRLIKRVARRVVEIKRGR